VSERAMRILVLTSSTVAAMNAGASVARLGGAGTSGVAVEMHQALEETHWIYGVGVEAYNIIQRTWPALHHIYYNIWRR